MAEIKLSIDPSESVQPVRNLADTLDELKGKFEDTEKTMKSTFSSSTKAVDSTTDAIQEQVKAQKINADAVDQTKKGVVEFSKTSKKAYDDKPVDEYAKSVKQADKATDDLDKSTDELGKSSSSVFGGLSEGLSEIGEGFGGLGEGLVSGEGGGISGGLTGILGKLGPIGLAVGAVVGVVGALGSEIVDVDKKFDGLRATVNSLFDATAEQADRIVVNVEAIADTFDQDVNEVLLATNTLAKEFGISGEEASNLVAKGFNSAANAQGDLVDGIKEYSAQIRASGGDANDLFKILEKSNEEGIFSDKGIDVVKEFGLRIREQTQGTVDALSNAFGADFTDNLLQGVQDGSISSIDALALVSEELGGLEENSQQAQTVIADVFGGAGEDAGFRFLTLLKDINDEQGFGNEQLTEAQQRQKENLEANQRLAAAQNDLSKAIGDSSAIGRVWTDVQTGFFKILLNVVEGVEALIAGFALLKDDPIEGLRQIGVVLLDVVLIPLNLAISALNTFVNLFGFDDVVSNIGFAGEAVREYTEEQERSISVTREAQKAIQTYGKETAVLVSNLEKSFAALEKGAATDEKRLKTVNELNKAYPEQTKNIDLLTASESELLKVKQDIIRAEVERSIAEKKAFAIRQLNNEIEIRQEQLKNENISDARRDQLEDEIAFLDQKTRAQIDAIEEETRLRLGLEDIVNEESEALAEENQKELSRINADGAKERLKQESEFNKAIQDILKRGQQAILNDQFLSEEDRINMNRDFQREQLQNLLTHAQDLNEALTGSRELDQEVIEAFNRADEKIITDAQDKIAKIQDQKRREERAKEIQQSTDLLKVKEERFAQEISLLKLQEEEELALIDQIQRNRGESELEFANRIDLEKLNVSEFYLQERIALIDREQALKLNALTLELEALADKEGQEVELKRIALEEKKRLIEQETSTQKEQLGLQLDQTRGAISELEGAVPSLGDVFAKIQGQLADSLGLDPQQLKAIAGAVQQVAQEIFNTIQENLSQQLEANDELLNKLDEREDKVKESLEREIEFAALGYAANVDAKREELRQIEEAQADAAKEREKILKQQALLDEISQISSLVTASASLYSSLAPLPFGIGIALATALTAGMFAAFIATKAKARNVASLEKGGYGDDSGLIKGRRHSAGGEALLDHIEVEDGEMWSVYNRRASGKYSDIIKDFTNAVNTDNLSGFMPNTSVPDLIIAKGNKLRSEEVVLQGAVVAGNLGQNLDTLPAIKDALMKKFSEPERNFFTKDGQVYMHEKWPNGRTKKTKINING